MTRSSPGVKRVAAILNFMASHPGQAFALSDIVRALKLSRATCHALLTGLVEVGYLYRATDKTYVLGPALAAIGRAAVEHSSPLQIAQPEMRALADAFDVVCGAYFLEADWLHVRERAFSMSHVGWPVPLGTRTPLRSVQAPAFFAHAPALLDAWLARTDAQPSPTRLRLMNEGMEFVRAHGFMAMQRVRATDLAQSSADQLGLHSDELPIAPLPQVDRDENYPVAAIIAPVLDSTGRAAFCLLLAGFGSALSGARILEIGEQLHQACARIARFSGFDIGRAA